MPFLIVGGLAGLVVGGGSVALFDGTTGKLTQLAKWAAIGGAVYVAGRHFNAW